MPVYTQKSDELQLDIITECVVFPALDVEREEELPEGFRALSTLWDTGSEVTLINPRVVKALGLKPMGKMQLDGVGGSDVEDTFAVHIKLPTATFACYVEATGSARTGEHDVVIGMDVIAFSDFCFTNKGGKSVFSLRFPSAEHVVLKD